MIFHNYVSSQEGKSPFFFGSIPDFSPISGLRRADVLLEAADARETRQGARGLTRGDVFYFVLSKWRV